MTYIGTFIVEKDIETENGVFPLYDDLFEDGRYDFTLDYIFNTIDIIIRPVGWTEDGLFSCQEADRDWREMRLQVVDTITDDRIGKWAAVDSNRVVDHLHDYKYYYFQDWEKEKMDLLLNDDADERLKANRQLVDVPLTLTDPDILLPQPFPLTSSRSRYNCWFNYMHFLAEVVQ